MNFQAPVIKVDMTFWRELCRLKLDEWKLDTPIVSVWGVVPCMFNKNTSSFSTIDLSSASFSPVISNDMTIKGIVRNFNSVDDYKSAVSQSTDVHEACQSKIINEDDTGANFVIYCFADLKNYKVFYSTVVVTLPFEDASISASASILSTSCSITVDSYSTLLGLFPNNKLFTTKFNSNIEFKGEFDRNNVDLFVLNASNQGGPFSPTLRSVLCTHPFAETIAVVHLHLVSATNDNASHDNSNSFIAPVTILNVKKRSETPFKRPSALAWSRDLHFSSSNSAANLVVKRIDLKSILDPIQLQSDAVDLNIKLMKWRVVPGLDIGSIQKRKALIIGSGTLGCAISRLLLGWGLTHLSFLDKGPVAFSNPVRQILFEHEDARKGISKAEAAAEAVRRIRPDVKVNHTNLSIPMIGHSESDFQPRIETLQNLIDEHDLVFFLTDNRESRWLPSVLSACKARSVRKTLVLEFITMALSGAKLEDFDTICDSFCNLRKMTEPLYITAALGFDSALVMRHAFVSPLHEELLAVCECIKKDFPTDWQLKSLDSSFMREFSHSFISPLALKVGLGCYFCDDVNAPTDSISRRTLDVQCTVTRPGGSMLASALAVELAANVLQSPFGVCAPHQAKDKNSGVLGAVPASLRLYLNDWKSVALEVSPVSTCTCCSINVEHELNQLGLQAFSEKVFSNGPSGSNFIENISGMTVRNEQLEAIFLKEDHEVSVDGDNEFDLL